MAKGTKSGWNPHTGGYNELTAAKLKNVALPDKIKCSRCNKFKGQTNYSNKQLADMRYHVFKRNGAAGVQIKCRACTGTQVNELHCYMCDQDKGLEEFAKAQRSKPDHAKCLECMEEQLKVDPDYEGSDPEDDEDDEDTDDTATNGSDDDDYYTTDGDTFSTHESSAMGESLTNSRASNVYSSLNSSGLSGGVNISGWHDENELVGADSGWFKPVRSSKAGTGSRSGFTSSKASSSSLGFDPKKYGDPTASSHDSRAPSITGSNASSFAAASSAKTASTARGSKWAKIPAYKPPKRDEPVEEEDEDDDEDDEVDDDWKTQTNKSDSEDDDEDSDAGSI